MAQEDATYEDMTYVVYDGECPFCSSYVKLLRLREAAGSIVLLNAREDHPVVRRVEQHGVVLTRRWRW